MSPGSGLVLVTSKSQVGGGVFLYLLRRFYFATTNVHIRLIYQLYKFWNFQVPEIPEPTPDASDAVLGRPLIPNKDPSICIDTILKDDHPPITKDFGEDDEMDKEGDNADKKGEAIEDRTSKEDTIKDGASFGTTNNKVTKDYKIEDNVKTGGASSEDIRDEIFTMGDDMAFEFQNEVWILRTDTRD